MSIRIFRGFYFETPLIVEGTNYGNLSIHGVGSTYEDDADLSFLEYKLDLIAYPCSNAMYTTWLLREADLNHIIKEHLKWLFVDLKSQAA